MSAEMIYDLCKFSILFGKNCPLFDSFKYAHDQFTNSHSLFIFKLLTIIIFDFKTDFSFTDHNREKRGK